MYLPHQWAQYFDRVVPILKEPLKIGEDGKEQQPVILKLDSQNILSTL